MTQADLTRAQEFLAGNGRRVELAAFESRFGSGTPQAFFRALDAYQGDDGGYGYGLEPDVRAPDSMPLHCEMALALMDMAGLRSVARADAIAGFLDGLAEPSGRVPIVTAAVADHPRAGHWNHPLFPAPSPNNVAALVGLLRAQGASHPWLDRAEAFCWKRLESPVDEAHEMAAALLFFEHVPDRARAEPLAAHVAAQAPSSRMFLRDPESENYGLTPLDLCPRPDCLARSGFDDDLLHAHLDALAAQQCDDGSWPVRFEPVGPGARIEWAGQFTLRAVTRLAAWGRL